MIDLPPPGASVLDRPIAVVRRGPADAGRRVLVVGSIHGDEPGGKAVTRALLRGRPPAGSAYYVVHDVNPDGARGRHRWNARGVDLNRNFPYRWRGAGRGRYWPGPSAASEPETRWVMRLTRAVRPDVSVWLHQPYGYVVPSDGSDRALLRRYARVARMPIRSLPSYRGTAVTWQNRLLGNGGAFVVELGPAPPSAAVVGRHVRAIRTLARAPLRAGTAATATAAAKGDRPAIVQTPIPFGEGRRLQMRRYARRHAGVDTAALRDPKVVVQHFTASTTFASAFSTFASNAPNLGEKPGVCAHFLIDRDGTIHQLVRLGLQCRHTVGLNHTAIGIEHVGTSDAGVMGNRRQLAASLRLTRWLQRRYGIATRNVIGHAESLSSPYHHERVASWRRLTHADFAHATMRRYRARL